MLTGPRRALSRFRNTQRPVAGGGAGDSISPDYRLSFRDSARRCCGMCAMLMTGSQVAVPADEPRGSTKG